MRKKLSFILSFLLLIFSNSLLASSSWESLGEPKNNPITSFFTKSQSNHDVIYAGSLGIGSNYLFKTVDGGKTWDKTANIINSGTGLYTRGYVSPSDSNIIYALAISYAMDNSNPFQLYLSDDSGNSWQKIEAKEPNSKQELLITDLAIDPQNPSTIYATTISGIFKSNDSGQNWISINTGLNSTDNSESKNVKNFELPIAIEVSAKNSNILYASLGSSIYKSVNYGVKWEKISSNQDKFTYQIVLDPNNQKNIYTMSVNLKNISEASLTKIIKLDKISDKIKNFYANNFNLKNNAEDNDDGEDNSDEGSEQDNEEENNKIDLSSLTFFSKSIDAGHSFKDISISDDINMAALFIDIDLKNSSKLLISGINGKLSAELFESKDHAKSFDRLDLGDFQEIGLNPIYAGNDGNIIYGGLTDLFYGSLNNNAINFNSVNSKFTNSLISQITSYDNKDIYFNSVSGIGSESLYKLNNFSNIELPETKNIELSRIYLNDDNSYYVGIFGDFYTKRKGQDNWELIKTSIFTEEYTVANQLLVTPEINSIFVITEDNSLYKSKDLEAESWEKITLPGKSLGNFKKLAYDSKKQYLYLATSTGLFVSKDHGQNFNKVMGIKNKKKNGIEDVLVSAVKPNQIYILLNNNLYISNDYGKTWKLSKKDLSDAKRSGIIALEKASNRIYIVSKNKNIQYSDDAGVTWNNIPSMLNASVFISSIYPTQDSLYAGAAGFGLFKITVRGQR